MKRLLVIVLLAVTSFSAYAQEGMVTGKSLIRQENLLSVRLSFMTGSPM
jgi:hypothetical protein